jgi:hypothetical protein
VAFLQEDVKDIHTRARDNFKVGGWTLNEFREATGKMPDPKGDYYLQPINILAISPDNRAAEAVQKIEQGKEPAEIDDGDEPPPEPAKALLAHTHLEKKTFDLDGLTVGREPRGVELVIDLKAIADDYESERAKAVRILTRFRDDLIDQAAAAIDKLDPKDVYTLTLVPDAGVRKQIAKVLQSAYRRGRQQIIAELNAQRAEKNIAPLLELKDDRDDQEFIEEMVDTIISKIINEIQSRAINVYTSLRILLDYSVDRLKELLRSESTRFIEDAAGNVVNASFSTGRAAEIENNLDVIDHCEYSAILDTNTCDPCEAADGQTASMPDDLPSAPNPDCDGGPRCRCFIVGVIV